MDRVKATAVGAAFAVLLLAGLAAIAGSALGACGIKMFGLSLSQCRPPILAQQPPVQPPARPASLEDHENARLTAELKSLELRLASLAACPLSPPPPEPVIAPPPPEPAPEPLPPPIEQARRPEPPAAPPPKLVLDVPKTLAELEGCWQSERGDLPLVSDDDSERPRGNVRICFCFGNAGQGSIRLIYTDAVVCQGPIAAILAGDLLRVEQPPFECGVRNGVPRGLVRTLTQCRARETGGAMCFTRSLGYLKSTTLERFVRVTRNYCGLD